MGPSRFALVTGGTGFVGGALVQRLAADGWQVRAAVRHESQIVSGANSYSIVGDINGSTDWTEAVTGVDAVFHLAGRAHVLRESASNPLSTFRAVNRDATIGLADAAKNAGCRRFLFVSSIGVNGNETHGKAMRASDKPAPHSPYAISKLEGERALAALTETGTMAHVVVRPPLILGPDPKGNLGSLLKAVRWGLPLPFGLVTDNRRDLVSRDTLVDLLVVAATHPAAAGATLLVSDGVSRSTRAIVEELARHDGRTPRFIPVPARLLAGALRLIGRSSLAAQLCGDLEVDMAPTCQSLGWLPPALHSHSLV
jgi:nucleoside-diphosphate-sugar epimerase